MNKTSIEYLDLTWNPVAMRCTPVSEGCAHCWHLRMAKRLAANPVFSDERRMAYRGDVFPMLIDDELGAPLRRKKSAVIGVQFMGDLMHPDVDAWDLYRIFGVMDTAPQHKFLVLTKRPGRLMELLDQGLLAAPYPDNVLLGVSAENQKRADERIPILLRIPAAGHFVSLEPMLGRVDLQNYLGVYTDGAPFIPCRNTLIDFTKPHGGIPEYAHLYTAAAKPPRSFQVQSGLDWVIAGGESGPGARPMHPDWARSARDQCVESGTPFLFKGWGTWVPVERESLMVISGRHRCVDFPDGQWMRRVGKKAAGRRLDGRTWDEYPEVMG